MLFIKTASIEDIPVIRELTYQVWPQTYTPILGQEQVAYMLELIYSHNSLKSQMENGHCFIVCFDDQLPVAFAAWSATGEKGIYKLHKIYIIPNQQAKGIGRFIMEYIISAIKKENALVLDLNVNRYNYPAQEFYKKIGFEKAGEEDIDIGCGYYMNDYMLRLHI